MKEDYLYRDPGHPWEEYLQSQAKMGNRVRKELVCPDEPQEGLSILAKPLKTRPRHLYPENPPNPR